MKRGTKHSAEARAKMSRKSAAKWRDPEYRSRMLPHLQAVGGCGGRRAGQKRTPEEKEKIRLGMIKRWQDPEYRGRHLPILLAAAKQGSAAYSARYKGKSKVRPPFGTPAYRQYEKIAAILGVDVARSMQW